MGIFYNKTVALIGPAPHITRTQQKQKIDDMEVVCRINEALPVPLWVKLMSSKRTDVLYIWRRVLPHRSWKDLKEIRLKPDAIWTNDWRKEGHLPFMEKIAVIHPKHFYDLRLGINTRPNTGLVAMLDILDDNPKKLYITGLTFYQGEGAYYKGYVSETRNKKISELKGNFAKHSQNPQLEYFKKYIYPLHNVECDDILKKICEQK